MGYPAGYRSAAARALATRGFRQGGQPKPWQRPVGPANDNVPRPANDNLPRLPGGRFKMSASMARALARLGYNPQDLIANGILNALNSLPGFATPKTMSEAAKSGIAMNFNGLPLYRQWSSDPVWGFQIEAAALRDTRQTGQALAAVIGNHKTVVVAPGGYLSTFETHWNAGVMAYRHDEIATYGPAAVSTNVNKYIWPYPPPVFNIPYTLVPYKRVDPDVYEAGNGEPAGPDADPVKKPLIFTPRRPPGPKVKERKTRAQKALISLLEYLGHGTEAVDFMDAFYDALPDKYKVKFKKGEPKWKQEIAKAKALYANYQHVDLDSALFNALWNNLEDRVYATLGIKGREYGASQGANRLIGQAFAAAVGDLLGKAKQSTQGGLNTIPGFTLK